MQNVADCEESKHNKNAYHFNGHFLDCARLLTWFFSSFCSKTMLPLKTDQHFLHLFNTNVSYFTERFPSSSSTSMFVHLFLSKWTHIFVWPLIKRDKARDILSSYCCSACVVLFVCSTSFARQSGRHYRWLCSCSCTLYAHCHHHGYHLSAAVHTLIVFCFCWFCCFISVTRP